MDLAISEATWLQSLGPHSHELLEQVGDVATECAKRADEHDRTGTFPAKDFDDLAAAGLNAATIPGEHGGLGLGPLNGDTLTLWLMTKELAKADLSLGRCWEGHTNSLVLLHALASEQQQERWFDGVVHRGQKWVAWSGEPQARKPGEGTRFGTSITAVEGGWVLDGTKAFATSATGADWALLLVNTAGPGGARHADAPPEGLLLLACDLSDPTVTVDESWWDPIGMRATASHVVEFGQTFLPEENLIGTPGAYLHQGWQSAFTPHYAASFLGAAEGAFDYALEYLARQNKTADPYVQQRAGSMKVNIETSHLWLAHVAQLWDSGQRAGAQRAGNSARHLVEHLALETVDHCVRACGARSLVRPSPVERILRDLTFYARHDNDDHVLATIGRAALGETHDSSFFKP
ncbi:alkylation response protein AidB-like acyl-CoA dehydrogenase [Prauserella sediminis]|uniref:Alkylation response protein AidB-like acyl-CoA dehydrogenase n=1 Tax=Prauserella sediminis TaxID=577680 RepID=A0A839XLP5_9PSEU|nr:acyl-CoA dehydrogenase family protein [Prauserella sediminis]MBB3661658.1 alkylation response protein AidB-like acyl-CoA dehydrogenase [Prauserella sediminis]